VSQLNHTIDGFLTAGNFAGVFETLSDLSAYDTTNSNANDFAYITGVTSINDGGAGYFRWVSDDQSVNEDGAMIIAPDSEDGSNGAWERIYDKTYVDPVWFGAVYDAVPAGFSIPMPDMTDNTAAVNSAIVFAQNNDIGIIKISGPCSMGCPAYLDTNKNGNLSDGLIIEIWAFLRLTETLEIPGNLHVWGMSGLHTEQFTKTTHVEIELQENAKPGFRLSGGRSNLIKNLSVTRRHGIGILLDTDSTNTALDSVIVGFCSNSATDKTQPALVVNDTYWVNITNCGFRADNSLGTDKSATAVLFTSTDYGFGTPQSFAGYVGHIIFERSFVTHGAIEIEINDAEKPLRNINIRDVDREIGNAPYIRISGTQGELKDLKIINGIIADTIGGTLNGSLADFIMNEADPSIDIYIDVARTGHLTTPLSIAGNPITALTVVGCHQQVAFAGTDGAWIDYYQNIGPYSNTMLPDTLEYVNSGDDYTGFIINNAASQQPTNANVTNNQSDFLGGTDAFQVAEEVNYDWFTDTNRTVSVGDFFIFTGFLKATDPESVEPLFGARILAETDHVLNPRGKSEQSNSLLHNREISAGSNGTGTNEVSWSRYLLFFKVTTILDNDGITEITSRETDTVFRIGRLGSSPSFLHFLPTVYYIPSGTYSDLELRKIAYKSLLPCKL
jgi:hypothetical protein